MPQMSQTMSREVMETAARESNTDVLDLPPLYDSLDPDALNTLIRSMSDGQVLFTYAGQRITVNSRGEVETTEQSSSRDPGEQIADD